MDFTKDELTLIRHGLDIVCRAEANSLSQTGLNGLKNGNVDVLANRLKMATDLDGKLNAEFARLSELEASAAVPDQKEG